MGDYSRIAGMNPLGQKVKAHEHKNPGWLIMKTVLQVFNYI